MSLTHTSRNRAKSLLEKTWPTERFNRRVIRDGWRLQFNLNTQVFAKIREGQAIIRDGWRLIFSLKT